MSTDIEHIRLSACIEELNTLAVMLSMAPSEINDDDLTNLCAALNTLKQRAQVCKPMTDPTLPADILVLGNWEKSSG
jgi:hypothetical protein